MPRNKGAKQTLEKQVQRQGAAILDQPTLEIRVQEHIAALPRQPLQVFMASFPVEIPENSGVTWEKLKDAWSLTSADVRFLKEKGLSPEETDFLFKHGTRPQFDPATGKITTEPLRMEELRRALRYINHMQAMPRQELLGWILVEPQLMYKPSTIKYIKDRARAQDGWVVQAFSPGFFKEALGEDLSLGKTRNEIGQAGTRLTAGIPRDCQEYMAFMVGASTLLPPEEFSGLSGKYTYIGNSLCTRYKNLDGTRSAAEVLFFGWEAALNSGQQERLLRDASNAGSPRHTWDSLETLCGTLRDTKRHIAALDNLGGREKRTDPELMAATGAFIQHYGQTNLPLFHRGVDKYYEVWQKQGQERLNQWLEHYATAKQDTYTWDQQRTLSNWAYTTPEDMSDWKELGFSSHPDSVWNQAGGYFSCTAKEYETYMHSLGVDTTEATRLVRHIRDAQGLDNFKFWYQHSDKVRSLLSETQGAAHRSMWGRRSGATSRIRNQLEKWARAGTPGRSAFLALGQDAFFVSPEIAIKTQAALNTTTYKKLRQKRFTPAAITGAVNNEAFPFVRTPTEGLQKEYSDILEDALVGRRLSKVGDLKDLSRLYREARPELAAKLPPTETAHIRNIISRCWPAVRSLPKEKRVAAISAAAAWLRTGFSLEDATRWWAAGWHPGEAQKAREAVGRYDETYTIEDMVRSEALLRGFSGQDVRRQNRA